MDDSTSSSSKPNSEQKHKAENNIREAACPDSLSLSTDLKTLVQTDLKLSLIEEKFNVYSNSASHSSAETPSNPRESLKSEPTSTCDASPELELPFTIKSEPIDDNEEPAAEQSPLEVSALSESEHRLIKCEQRDSGPIVQSICNQDQQQFKVETEIDGLHPPAISSVCSPSTSTANRNPDAAIKSEMLPDDEAFEFVTQSFFDSNTNQYETATDHDSVCQPGISAISDHSQLQRNIKVDPDSQPSTSGCTAATNRFESPYQLRSKPKSLVKMEPPSEPVDLVEPELKKQFSCGTCFLLVGNNAGLQLHRKCHIKTDKKPYDCDLCPPPTCFDHLAKLKYHRKKFHGVGLSGPDEAILQGQMEGRRKQQDVHRRKIQPFMMRKKRQKFVECVQCNRKVSLKSYREHVTKHSESEDRKVPCMICRSWFMATNISRRRHMWLHHTHVEQQIAMALRKTRHCPFCVHSKFDSELALKEHLNEYHEEELVLKIQSEAIKAKAAAVPLTPRAQRLKRRRRSSGDGQTGSEWLHHEQGEQKIATELLKTRHCPFCVHAEFESELALKEHLDEYHDKELVLKIQAESSQSNVDVMPLTHSHRAKTVKKRRSWGQFGSKALTVKYEILLD